MLRKLQRNLKGVNERKRKKMNVRESKNELSTFKYFQKYWLYMTEVVYLLRNKKNFFQAIESSGHDIIIFLTKF